MHFDFGEALRASVERQAKTLTSGERDCVSVLLKTGALLADTHFGVARKLLVGFLTRQNADRDALVVLNGLPRHTDQAKAMEALVDMKALISLECEPEIAWERIRANTGGDRGKRSDDTFEQVEQRLYLFRQATMPLLKYYCARGVYIFRTNVGIRTTPEETYQEVETQLPPMLT